MLQTGDGGEEIQVFPIDVNESLEIICILLGVQSLNLKKAQNNAFDLSVFFCDDSLWSKHLLLKRRFSVHPQGTSGSRALARELGVSHQYTPCLYRTAIVCISKMIR